MFASPVDRSDLGAKTSIKTTKGMCGRPARPAYPGPLPGAAVFRGLNRQTGRQPIHVSRLDPLGRLHACLAPFVVVVAAAAVVAVIWLAVLGIDPGSWAGWCSRGWFSGCINGPR